MNKKNGYKRKRRPSSFDLALRLTLSLTIVKDMASIERT